MKKLLFILISLFISFSVYSQHEHEFELPENALLFPQEETGYDWQCSDEAQEVSIWVGVGISEEPNKLGNYAYSVYVTSNTYDENDNILDVVLVNIDILYYSHTKYLQQRSNDKGLLQSKDNFKQQVIQEVNAYENKEDLLSFVEDFNSQTLLITHDPVLVHTFFLPDRESDVIVLWEYMKKLVK